MFLHGDTGAGKSYMARQIYEFSVRHGVLPEGAPFITLNCAQYANNVELLSSNLFGYVKGAFTGAYGTSKGLLEAADGGMLFLDEVHRLNNESQEKLFIFLDQGIFRRMGESGGGIRQKLGSSWLPQKISVLNQCRYLAEQADAVVISPEYRLAPETPFPGALDDVMGTLDWITEHTEELKIDEDKIAVMGESAGGTLAANCCLRDQKERIKLAVYIYGALDLTPAEKTPYHWDYSLYDMYEGQKDYIMNRLFRFKELTDYMEDLYVQNGYSTMDGEVSPLYAEDLSKMPKTLMVEAEFGYFKICNDEFIKRLTEAGIDTEVILYEGLDHGFFDRIGSLPQAEDCIREITERVKRL